MKKSALLHIRISDIVIITFAFMGGSLAYFLGVVGIDKITPTANATIGTLSEQIVTENKTFDSIAEFSPNPALPGSGTQEDPYISSNMRVNLTFKIDGIGKVTIEDENGTILYEYDQIVSQNPGHIVPIVFTKAGNHSLTIKVNGDDYISNVNTKLHFRVGKLPPIVPNIPGVPNTGNYIYIGGYAVQTYSLLTSGMLVAILTGVLLFFYHRYQHHNAKTTKKPKPTERPTSKKKKKRQSAKKS